MGQSRWGRVGGTEKVGQVNKVDSLSMLLEC